MRTMVTIICPTYNRRNRIENTLNSVRGQHYRRFQLILVDDGSTDGTGDRVKDLRESFGLRYLRLPHSGMPGKVRNAGARLATGRYLAFLDSDDQWKPEKLARQIAFFEEHRDLRICHTREIWRRGDKIVSQAGQRHKRSGYIFPDALKKCIIGPSTVMMRRGLFEEFGGFREDMEIAEDYELWLRITARYPVGYIDEPLVVKQGGHPDQLSEKYGQIESFRIRALLLNLEDGTFVGEKRELAVRELARKCEIHARGCERRGKSEEARRCREIASRYASEASTTVPCSPPRSDRAPL
jgi:glycosyltransferase involved in cell wall biosynthesis